MNSTTKTVVIGGASGAWGDSSFAAPQLLETGRCDYILFEALAEITMGILTRAQEKDRSLGYATDVIQMIARDLPSIAEQGVRIVTNAGGINPRSAAEVLRATAQEAGVPLRIAWVEGDNLMDRLVELRALDLHDMFDGTPLVDDPLSFNAYLGARPIASALSAGAQIVITGRCVDSALTLGPLIHEFGWGAEDLDALSQGSLAGHLLECGTQATGGILTDFEDVGSWEGLGYPMAECRADGSFVLTKPEGSAGIVDERTASEQLLYEIGDPSGYLLPDVTCDWREVRLRVVGDDRVEVTGAKGLRPPKTFKACAQTIDGYRVAPLLFIGGRDAPKKASRLADAVLTRVGRVLEREGFSGLRASDVEVLGAEATYGPHSRATKSREVMAKIALHHDSRRALALAVRELGSFGMVVPGLSGGGTGLPRPTPVIKLHSYLVSRDAFRPAVFVDGTQLLYREPGISEASDPRVREPEEAPPFDVVDPIEVPLVAVAHGRSGDKGADSNIGIRARHEDFLPLVRDQLTSQAVAAWFAHRLADQPRGECPVRRFDLPGIHALNFVLEDALGGGGIGSLRIDPQGKAYAQQLLDMPVSIPRAWLDHPAYREPS